MSGTRRNPAPHPKVAHEARVLERDGTITPAERAERDRALDLLAQHWPELATRIRGWLGTAATEDEAWLGEVALLMARRIRKGRGIVAPLRDIPRGDPRERLLIFGAARFATRDVVKQVGAYRRWRSTLTVDSAFPAQAAAEDAVSLPHASSIEDLLREGENVWSQLCDAGVLRPTEWTEDDKWTAIGMMWDFAPSDIAMIRFARANAPSAVLKDHGRSTIARMRAVRRKGSRKLGGTSQSVRSEYGLRDPPVQANKRPARRG